MKKTVLAVFLVLMGVYALDLDAGLFRRRCCPVVVPQNTGCGTMEEATNYVAENKVEDTESILRRNSGNCPSSSSQQNGEDDTLAEVVNLQNQVDSLVEVVTKMNEEPAEPENTDTPWMYAVIGLVLGGIATLLVKFRDLKYGK